MSLSNDEMNRINKQFKDLSNKKKKTRLMNFEKFYKWLKKVAMWVITNFDKEIIKWLWKKLREWHGF
jgi:hypothetical protein